MFNLQFTPLIVPMLLAAGLSGFLAYFQWKRRAGSGTASFIALMIGATIWTTISALELASPTLQAKFIFTVVNYVGITLTTAAWFTFTLEYTGQEGLLTPRYIALLTVEPMLAVVLAATNPLHHLFWTRFALSAEGALAVVHGPAFWGHVAYSYLLMLAGAGLLIRAFIISPQFYRGQVVTMLLAAGAPWAANFLYISRLSPFPNLDLTPFGFTFTGVFLSWSMMRYHLLDVIPIARHTVIQSMGDAMLVLDKRDRILDANPAALRLFACTTTTRLVGQPVEQVLPPWAEIAEAGHSPDESDHEFKLGADCERRAFRMHISPVHNRHGEVKGRVILLRDITSQRQAEEDLRGVLAAMRDAILVLDSEGRYLRTAHTSPDFPLPRPGDLVGKTMREVFEAPKAEEFLGYVREALETGQTVRAEYSLPVGEEERWINASISPMEDDRVVWVSRDMTERRRAEQALHESEERFRMLFHHSPDAIVLLDPSVDDPSWPIVDCNEAFLAMNGFERDELIGQSIDVVHVNPDSTAGRQAFLEQLQREGRVENEIVHERRDGTTYPVHFLSTLVNLNGKPLVLGIDRDITAQKQAEQALHESEERFRMLFHYSPDAIVLFDPSFGDPLWPIVDCNEAFLNMNGYERDELIGQSIETVNLAPTSLEKHREFISRLERDGLVERENVHRRKDGTIYPIHFMATLVTLNGKQLIMGVDRDITAQKQAEQAMQESEERFRMLFHHSPDAIVLLDPSVDHPSWPIVDCNEAFLAMNGFERDELIGQSIDVVHMSEESPGNRREFLKHLEREGQVENEITHCRRDGTTYPVHFLTALVKLGGKQLVLGIDRDISERKRAEAEIQRYRDHLEELVAERTAELNEANRTISASLQEKEVLLKEIHHRVKNNLQVISSLLNLQSGYIEDEAAITLFTESRNRVHSMALIHEQLYRSTDFTRVDFATYAQELTRRLLVSYRALANGIDLRLSFDEIYLDVTTAIPCGLIINELVSNAIKHGFPDGQRGVIEVEMAVDKRGEEEGYRLTVHNDGAAFPEGLDFRNTDTLGLQLVNSLTRQLDGEIELQREAGTTFEIRFPCPE